MLQHLRVLPVWEAVALLFNAGGLNLIFFNVLSISLQCQRGETALLISDLFRENRCWNIRAFCRYEKR
jgi:hypothetical protein